MKGRAGRGKLSRMYRHVLPEALAAQVALVDRLSVGDLESASHCDGWLVGDVLQHSLGVTWKFTRFAQGETDRPRTPPGDLVGPDHRASMRAAAEAATAAWAGLAAEAGPDRRCHLSFGEFSADEAAGINLFDVLAHGWDVAGPAGHHFDVPDELWACGLRAARLVVGSARDQAHYGPERPTANEGPRARFLAFLGRVDGPEDLPPSL